MKNPVEIVFATNNEYLPYLAVAIRSIISHADPGREYRIHILYREIAENNRSRVMRMAIDGVAIEFVNVSEMVSGRNYYGGVRADTKHITEETFYRLLIPELWPVKEKILYLDCDLIATSDVGELFDIDLEGKTIGAVSSAVYWNRNDDNQFPDKDHEWFNAGVMLWDAKMWTEKEYTRKCEKVGGRTKLETGDQELLQIVCRDDVKYLPHKWNLLWHHAVDDLFALKGTASIEYEKVSRHASIIHYSSRIKPWNAPDRNLADLFWQEARQTAFYEQILYANLRNQVGNELFGKYIFPFDRIRRGETIVLYGAGVVGKIFKAQLALVNWCVVSAWADKNYDSDRGRRESLISPQSIGRMPFDHLVIAVEKGDIAGTIKDELVMLGIEAKKIIWEDPLL